MKNDTMTKAAPASGPGTLPPFVPPAETHPNRGAGETECLTELVFQVPAVGKVDLCRIIHEQDEGRRRDIGLSCVKELQPFPGLARRRMRGDCFFQHLVQRGCRHASVALADYRE